MLPYENPKGQLVVSLECETQNSRREASIYGGEYCNREFCELKNFVVVLCLLNCFFIGKDYFLEKHPAQIGEEVVAQRCSVKKVFLEISENSEENFCARVSFFEV